MSQVKLLSDSSRLVNINVLLVDPLAALSSNDKFGEPYMYYLVLSSKICENNSIKYRSKRYRPLLLKE